jgi:hypothetical protein
MEDTPMPDSDALIDALGGKKVTITIAEKTGTEVTDSDVAVSEDTFTIDNGKKILTITIAE